MRNVLVTGAASPLGRGLLAHLRRTETSERLFATDPADRPHVGDGVEHVALTHDHREVVDFLTKQEIDTVIHCGLAPDRNGAHREASEASVIETMRLGAAVASNEVPVRAWVIASSSAAYPVDSRAPLLQSEDAVTGRGEGTRAETVIEAEDYIRDVAERAAHINVSIMRLQHLVGEGASSPLAALLSQPILPAVIGHDPALQLLALDDAVGALAFAAELELAGVYNVASAGLFRFSEAVRTLERPTVPVLPFGVGPFAGLARWLSLPHVPSDVIDLLRFGHAIDTAKLTRAGFEADYDQAACLGALRRA